jgi:hypothetical protein
MSCAFFWVIPWHLNFICRGFGTLCLFHLHRWVGTYLPAYEDGTDSVLKRWHIKFRRQGITQKKAYNILIRVCLFDVFIDFVLTVSMKLLCNHLKLFLLFLKIVCCYNQYINQ